MGRADLERQRRGLLIVIASCAALFAAFLLGEYVATPGVGAFLGTWSDGTNSVQFTDDHLVKMSLNGLVFTTETTFTRGRAFWQTPSEFARPQDNALTFYDAYPDAGHLHVIWTTYGGESHVIDLPQRS